MKVLESAPQRYERGMRILTLGRLERVHRDIAAWMEAGDRVLDLGCGTGALAVMIARKGVHVTGVDISAAMLGQAAERIREEVLQEQVTLREMGAVDLDTVFADGCFDAVTSTLVFSELSDDEIDYTLAECRRVLRAGGRLLIADEVLPDSALCRVATALFRLPFAVLAYLLTQNTTRRVAALAPRIEGAGYRMLESRKYLAGTLRLYVGEKVD
jgi:demethylmenaquinone methyltransferase/2-methoxy-6-polyprenyl-1,4-benzoquinol methylase